MEQNIEKGNSNKKLQKDITEEEIQLLNELEEALTGYLPNWQNIIRANQFHKKISDDKAYAYKIKVFCQKIAEYQQRRGLSYRALGEISGVSHTQIQKIVKEKIKNISYTQVEKFAEVFGVSAAYLIGLTNKESYVPSIVRMYFWEHPKCKYIKVKKLAESQLVYYGRKPMIETYSRSHEDMQKHLCEMIISNAKLADLICDLLDAPEPKRSRYIKILEELKKF